MNGLIVHRQEEVVSDQEVKGALCVPVIVSGTYTLRLPASALIGSLVLSKKFFVAPLGLIAMVPARWQIALPQANSITSTCASREDKLEGFQVGQWTNKKHPYGKTTPRMWVIR